MVCDIPLLCPILHHPDLWHFFSPLFILNQERCSLLDFSTVLVRMFGWVEEVVSMEWGELEIEETNHSSALRPFALSCSPLVKHCLVPPDCLCLPLMVFYIVGLQTQPPFALTDSPQAALPLKGEPRKLERTASCPKAPIRYFCLV